MKASPPVFVIILIILKYSSLHTKNKILGIQIQLSKLQKSQFNGVKRSFYPNDTGQQAFTYNNNQINVCGAL